jgi:hypothetical protein
VAAIALHDLSPLEAVDDVVTGLAAAVDELLAVDVDALDDGGLGRLLATGETTLRRVQGMQASSPRP